MKRNFKRNSNSFNLPKPISSYKILIKYYLVGRLSNSLIQTLIVVLLFRHFNYTEKIKAELLFNITKLYLKVFVSCFDFFSL